MGKFFGPMLGLDHQGSILGPLFFIININDLWKDVSWNTIFFANNTSLFSVIHNSNTSRIELNDDMSVI